ncbi:DUF3597 family protein [Altererythrobacter salegens]|uniref:DUF3597 family protein n=1 Tax=Croceibacterium salegens TaxID=1737568 RepID=A0A6I4SWI2_9SPHN|nr:DUF3597 domain-containing protein [Croceibacterium salegens]MXO60193.1 DUF3597 family protein [Croceibacterium salegens]
MSIFGKIKNAIFGHKEEAKPATTSAIPMNKPAQLQPITEVDVEKKLDSMPGADKLNWRTSIVDLMKLIDVDASYESRKELAVEMGRNDYSGSVEDNIWLHRRVMQDLAKNGGKVPAEYVD